MMPTRAAGGDSLLTMLMFQFEKRRLSCDLFGPGCVSDVMTDDVDSISAPFLQKGLVGIKEKHNTQHWTSNTPS